MTLIHLLYGYHSELRDNFFETEYTVYQSEVNECNSSVLTFCKLEANILISLTKSDIFCNHTASIFSRFFANTQLRNMNLVTLSFICLVLGLFMQINGFTRTFRRVNPSAVANRWKNRPNYIPPQCVPGEMATPTANKTTYICIKVNKNPETK